MEVEDLPTGWHLPRGTWFVVATPEPRTPLEFIGQVIRESDGKTNYVPLFTTERKAGDYIFNRLLRAIPQSFHDPCLLGTNLDGLAALGITHLAFDPIDPNDPNLIPISAAADDLLRRLGM